MPRASTADGAFVPFSRRDTDQTIVSRFAQQARRQPHHPAIDAADGTLTYAELDRRSDQIANALLASAEANDCAAPVALLFGQSADMVAAILGVLKAGRAYVPLDPNHPVARLQQILSSAKSDVVLTGNEHAGIAAGCVNQATAVLNTNCVADRESASPPAVSIGPDQSAYVLFTSGSTGCPKGVVQTHRNVLCNIRNYTNDICITPVDRVSLLTTFGFAASVSDLFGGLLNGATVCLFDLQRSSVQSCLRWLQDKRITIYFSVPSVFRLLVASMTEADDISHLRVIKLGGDKVTHADVEAYRRRFSDDCRLVINLGATELNVICRLVVDKDTVFPVGVVPVGYPPDGVELRLVDEAGDVVPHGHIGELLVRSAHLSPGYWGETPAHGSRLLQDPEEPEQRTFRTGDIGRFMDDGCLVHLGRSDSQVKISGQSVSLLELEAVLAQVPAVREAAVVATCDHDGNSRLVAYLVGEAGAAPSVRGVRQFLEERLPRYMVPQDLCVVDEFRYNANGKLDRSALAMQRSDDVSAVDSEASLAACVEAQICGIWRDVLGVDAVTVNDRFFALGGSSLLAFKSIEALRREFGVDVSLSTFFDNATPARLSVVVGELLVAEQLV